MGKKSVPAADPLVDSIIQETRWPNTASELITIAIPSHDQKGQQLRTRLQMQWAEKSMKLLADHFDGATALPTAKGIYKSKEKRKYLWDDTIMVETYCPPGTCSDAAIIREIVEFAREMRVALDQEAVMVVFNRVLKFITKGR